MIDEMYCEECHRTEGDPLMLDVEMCGACGSNLTTLDSDERDLRRLMEDASE